MSPCTSQHRLRLLTNDRNCTGPVSNLVDFIPLLQKLPNPLTSRGKRLHKGLVETYGGLVKGVEQKVKRGEPVEDCLAKTLAQIRDEEQLDDLDMAIMASAFLIGGVETVRLPAGPLLVHC